MTRTTLWRRVRLRVVLLTMSTVVGLLAGETGSRLFWLVRAGVPWNDPGRILYEQYPGLKRIDADLPALNDGCFDVLLLGASTLNADFGQIEPLLQERLSSGGRENVRIYNLADHGHSSRDSRLKYEAVGEARFDLIVVYDGINDARANNAPPDVFQHDYSHIPWYDFGNGLARHHGRARFALPYTLEFLAAKLYRGARPDRYIPFGRPREEWLVHGEIPLSAGPFHENLNALLDLARRRSEKMVLLTFATHFAEGYSLEKFQERRLDYGLHTSPIEMWGSPGHIENAVVVHNEVIRRLAAEHDEALFIDMANFLDRDAATFNDVCHLTERGCRLFVERLVSTLEADSRTSHSNGATPQVALESQ